MIFKLYTLFGREVVYGILKLRNKIQVRLVKDCPDFFTDNWFQHVILGTWIICNLNFYSWLLDLSSFVSPGYRCMMLGFYTSEWGKLSYDAGAKPNWNYLQILWLGQANQLLLFFPKNYCLHQVKMTGNWGKPQILINFKVRHGTALDLVSVTSDTAR